MLPRILALGMSTRSFGERRRKALAGVGGRVLELGFGAGLNLPHYPLGVEELLAIEPVQVNRKLARARIEAAPFPVRWAGLVGETLPVESSSMDAVTSTWTLCTVSDPGRALAEIQRVLKPGGQLHFLEHGHAPDPGVARWQRRLGPLQCCVFGGCHLDRQIDALIEAAEFELTSIERGYMPGPKISAFLYQGTARPVR